MSRPALLPAAALRLALRGVVLLGGLFALGFLFGGQAQAADGTSALTETVSAATTSTTSTSSTSSTTKAVTASPQGASTNPVTPVRERVVKPVGEVLEGVSEKLAEAETEVTPVASLPSFSRLPTLPPLGSLPELPDAPSLPSLPTLPSLRSLPTLPVPQPGPALPAPVASGPGQDSGFGTVEAAAAPQPSYGPRGVVREAPVGPVAHGGGQHRGGHAATGGHTAVQVTPAGVPDGALGSASLLDSGGPRHADAHAVTPCHRVPLLLVPGSAVRMDAAGIRDRYRDIPVFPG
ncbi:hypothetical protein [Streptomyces sp. NPDC058335]|uniref:hypothetical protein n=1 Tax=Streptomyces sp. NPDC058335 TaxID=3346451 RepID=UPI0036660AEC